MLQRTLLIAGNWKMNSAPKSLETYKSIKNIEVVVFPTFLDLAPCIKERILTGGQFGRHDDYGPFTGDVSMKMLKDVGCTYVLCGHSERRQHHHETDHNVATQALAALRHSLHPVICIGETEEERATGKEHEVIRQQVNTVLSVIGDAAVTWAYEPVWAIGTGKNASPADAGIMHAFIRSLLPKSLQQSTRILYGGSMKPANCRELLEQPNIDGGLVGGASLDPVQFGEIVTIAATIKKGEIE